MLALTTLGGRRPPDLGNGEVSLGGFTAVPAEHACRTSVRQTPMVSLPDWRRPHGDRPWDRPWDKGFVCFHYLRPTFGKLFSASFADEETEAQHNHLPKGRGLDRAHVFLTPSHPTVLQTACPWP